MRPWVLRINIFISGLGICLSFSAFIVYFIFYKNVVAGTWAFISGVFACLCFQLHYLFWRKRLDDYHTANTLMRLGDLGFFVAVISSGFFFWYIFVLIYWPVPNMSIQENVIITCVWAFMTAKWGFLLHVGSKKYAHRLSIMLNPLLPGSSRC